MEIIKVFFNNVLKNTLWYQGALVSLGGFDVKDYGRVCISLAWYDVVFLGMIVWYYLSWNVLKRPPKPRSYSYHQLLTQTQDK